MAHTIEEIGNRNRNGRFHLSVLRDGDFIGRLITADDPRNILNTTVKWSAIEWREDNGRRMRIDFEMVVFGGMTIDEIIEDWVEWAEPVDFEETIHAIDFRNNRTVVF